MFVLSAVIGFGIGILSGLLGIGGGTIMVPTFRLAFGMSAIASTATSLFAIIPTSISGAVSHIRQKTCIPALGLACGIGGAITSPLGVYLASISPEWLVMVVAAVIIGWSAVNMLSKAAKMKPAKVAAAEAAATAEASAAPAPAASLAGAAGEGADLATAAAAEAPAAGAAGTAAASAAPAAPAATAPALEENPKLSPKQLLIGVCIGMFAGVASGYVGVGGGFLMVPLMLSLVHINMSKASGTSLIAVMILAIPGVIEQAVLGNINYIVGIAIAVGSIPGAVVGAKLVKVVPERTLRFVFGFFLLVAAALLAVNEFGILG